MAVSAVRTVYATPTNCCETLCFPCADPFNVLDYTLDFSAWVADYGGTNTDAIASINIAIKPSGTLEAQLSDLSVNGFQITFNIGDGVAGRYYIIRYEIGMMSGRDFEFEVGLQINSLLAAFPPTYPDSLDFGNRFPLIPSLNFSKISNTQLYL